MIVHITRGMQTTVIAQPHQIRIGVFVGLYVWYKCTLPPLRKITSIVLRSDAESGLRNEASEREDTDLVTVTVTDGGLTFLPLVLARRPPAHLV